MQKFHKGIIIICRKESYKPKNKITMCGTGGKVKLPELYLTIFNPDFFNLKKSVLLYIL